MTEQDVFESRLHAALVRHVANGPTDFDALGFAREVAAKEPRRHGFAAALAWRGVALPRRAWALLLVAGLLAALVGGSLLVGSLRERRLPVVVPPVGQVFECPPGSTPDKPGPIDQARPPQNSNASLAFDRRAGRLVAFTRAETWTFDVCTNTWTQQHPYQQPRGVDEWSLFIYDVDSDLTIAVDRSDGTVWAYDLQADTWTRKGNGPVAARTGAYDPLTGLVVAATDADPVELWTYDVEADTWTPVHLGDEAPGLVPGGALAYDASVDRFVWYGDGTGGSPPYETWLFDIRTGTWARSAAERPAVGGWMVPPGLAYDEAAGKTVVLLRDPETTYDATADRWEVLADTWPYWSYPGRMVYDPVNRRLVGLGQTLGMGDAPPGAVEALDLVTGERRVLLEGDGGQAAKTPAPTSAPAVGPAFACPPGSDPDEPGPVDQARPVIGDGVAGMAFDRRAGRLVAFTSAETWTFDVCTNTWTLMHPEREPPPGTGQLVYDVDSDVTIASDGTRTWAYDLEANTWTEKRPLARDGKVSIQFYDPVSGLVVALGRGGHEGTLGLELWSYDVETDTWTPIPQAEPLAIGPHYEFFAYDTSVDRLVAYANAWGPPDEDENRVWEARTWLFDLRTGTWSGTSAVTPPGFTAGMFGQEPAIAYDEAAQRTVILGQGQSAAYDATADRWDTLYVGTRSDEPGACGTRPECRQLPFMVYDPVNERLVVYGGSIWTDSDPLSHWVSPDDVLAFDTRTREWTVLLEPTPSAARPAAGTAQAFACPAGSTPDTPGPVDQERPARNASAAIAFDRRAGRIVLLAPSAGAAAETWTFDVCSNMYARMRPAREPVLLEASHLVYDGDSGVTIATDGRTTWAYDLKANTWTQMSVPPAAADPAAPSLAYVPVSGLVMAASGRELWSFDFGTDLWALVSEAPWPGTAVLAYDASVDRIVADAGSEMWLYDIRNGTWSRGTDPTFCAWGMAMMVPEVIVYDEAAKRTVVSCGTRAAYDATAGRWEFMADIPGTFPSSMAFDIVDERLVGIGEIQDGVFAWDLETREQITLLEPVRG